jgi:ferritin
VLTADVESALNIHMGREFAAHLQYLSVSAWLSSEGLPELAQFFRRQAAEEHIHAMKFWQYVIDAGGLPVIPALEPPQTRFEGAEGAVQLSLDQEVAVTNQIHELLQMAIDRRDFATQAFLQWFVTEQVEEVATMTELLQVVRRAGETNLLLVEGYVARKSGGEAETG